MIRLMLCWLLCSLAAVALAALEIKAWTVFGPYENVVEPEGRKGLDKDYLTGMGGEAMMSRPTTSFGTTTSQVAKPVQDGVVSFASLFSPSDNKVAYALADVTVGNDQTVGALFGSDDGAMVWVNGERIYRFEGNRGIVPGQDQFQLKLRKGPNRILVKVENGGGGWGFALELLDAKAAKARADAQARAEFPSARIVPASETGHFLLGADIPGFQWVDPERAKKHVKGPIRARWFDDRLTEVTRAEKPGRYVALLEIDLKSGKRLQQTKTFVRMADGVYERMERPPFSSVRYPEVEIPPMPGSPIPVENWRKYMPFLSNFLWEIYGQEWTQGELAAKTAQYLARPTASGLTPSLVNNPWFEDVQFVLNLRRKLEGLKGDPLKLPATQNPPATVITPGTEADARVAPGTAEALRKLCAEWSEKEGVPLSVLVARNGKVFLHEGFGTVEGKKATKDMVFYPASIGKTIAATVFMQFVDQGLIDLDQPLSKILKPLEGSPVTARMCFAHLSGLTGHTTFRGLANPFLDGAFAAGPLGMNEPGQVFRYGGDGNNLAGIAMQMVAGRTMVQLLYDQLFVPLGMDRHSQFDLGWGETTVAEDLAKFGQMILNMGAYGERRFFSEKTWQEFLPQPLKNHFPAFGKSDQQWGVGCEWFQVADAGPGGTANPLGDRVLGHGSASSSVFRVDLEHGYVIVVGKPTMGDAGAYEKYKHEMMKVLAGAVR